MDAARSLRVLHIEDNLDDALLLVETLKEGGFSPIVHRVETHLTMREALASGVWDLIVSDYALPNFSGPAALALLRDSGLDIPFIIVSGTVNEEIAVTSMKAGAHDCVTKSGIARLIPAIERELKEARGRRERREAEEALRRSEQQLRQAQKMEVVGRLAGGVAHDFNNMLTVISGYTDLLLSRLALADPNRKNLEEIRKASQRAALITSQLLVFSRRQIAHPVVLDVNAAISDTGKLLQRLIGEDVRLQLELSPDAGSITSDPGQFDQVLMNLAVNARDAMPRGGTVILRTGRVSLAGGLPAAQGETLSKGTYLLLEVADTGTGIPPEAMPNIFEPFFTTKEVGKGTGLGLATVFGIVKQGGGGIRVQSRVGEGTTFLLYFPRVEAAPPALPESGFSSGPGGSETILLVEDEGMVRDLTREILEAAGYQVLVADGADAASRISRTRTEPIHLLLTDVVMPGMNGRELADGLRFGRPDLRILFMSGYTDDAMLIRGVMQTGLRLIKKPFSREELLRMVREAVGTDGSAGS